MKTYYVSSGLQGCYLVRCLLPLQENGWDGDTISLLDNAVSPDHKAQAVQNADVVVFHRPEQKQKLELARILKEKGKKIVFDNDDTARHDGGFRFNEVMNEVRVKNGLKTVNETLEAFMKEADLITCSTQFLADEYRETNPNVIVLPNCVDPFMWDEPLRNEGDKVRIGITGSIAITDDINVVEPIIRHYENDSRVQLVLMSLPPKGKDEVVRSLYQHEYEFWDSANIEWHPFSPVSTYSIDLNELRLDMMIIPRADNYFNRCKSNVKFLEASMCEIPVIAQSFPDGNSPYEIHREDTKYLALATDTESWIRAIEVLIQDKQLRQFMGKRAREYVERAYSIENNGHKWRDAYESLYE
jgi:glycosyltransferase involved in cell wall biosynthesis